MPELKQIETAAQNVQNGDHLVYTNRDGFVASKKVGKKWTEIREANGALIARVENGTMLEVGRMMPTEADQEAAKEKYLEQRAVKFLADLEATYPAAVKALQENLAKGYTVTDSIMEQLIVGDVHNSYAARLRRGLEHHAGQKTLRDLITMLKDELEEEFIDSNGVGRWSGGFTIMNAREQLEFQTKKTIYRSIKWAF